MMWIASFTALVSGGVWAWWTSMETNATVETSAPPPGQLARLERRFLHVRDATMRLNETALQRAKLDEERQTIEQLTRIKEGVQLLLDALERNMIRHQACTSAEAMTLERQLADTSKALRDVLDLERHPNQPPEDWIPKLNRIEDALAKHAGFNRVQKIDNQSNALINLDLLFQSKSAFQEA